MQPRRLFSRRCLSNHVLGRERQSISSTQHDENDDGRDVEHVPADHATIGLQEDKLLEVELEGIRPQATSKVNKKFLSKYGLGEAKMFSP